MIYAVIVVRVVQLSVAQEARLGAAAAEVAMAIVHVAKARRAPIMWARAHVGVVALPVTAPRGRLFEVNSVCLGYCSRPKPYVTYHVTQPLTEVVLL
jgi:hypothetical protein